MFRILKRSVISKLSPNVHPRFFSSSRSPPPPPPYPPLSGSSHLLIPTVIGAGVTVLTYFVYESLPALRAIPEAVEVLKASDIPALVEDMSGAINMVRDVVEKGVVFKFLGVPVGSASVNEETKKEKKEW